MALRRENGHFEPRYTYGGDEFILVDFDDAMSLEVNLRVQEISARVEQSRLPGVIDVCPANISYLVRYDPDVVQPAKLVDALKSIGEEDLAHELVPFATRIVDVPILYNDPWTHQVLMKFRDRVQDPNATDAEHLARVNGLAGPDELVREVTSTPHMVTMTGFVPGVVWSFQLVEKHRQLQGPKYLRPRTETPDRAFALGGAFTAIYPAPSAGGYPIFGRAAAPIYDPERRLADLAETGWLVRIGDIYNYRPIDREEYDDIRAQVAEGAFGYRQCPHEFDPAAFFAGPDEYCQGLVRSLYGEVTVR
jgi:urea carboxylase